MAVTEAGDDKDARKAAQATLKDLEKPGKDLDKAEKAAAKADDNLTKAREAVATAESRVEELAGAAALTTREVDDVRAEADRRRPALAAVSLFEAPATEGVEDDLPHDVEHRRHLHPHESPPTMLIPLVVLSIGALAAGLLNLPFTSGTKRARALAGARHPGQRASSGPVGGGPGDPGRRHHAGGVGGHRRRRGPSTCGVAWRRPSSRSRCWPTPGTSTRRWPR